MPGEELHIVSRLIQLIRNAFAVFMASETPLYVKLVLAGGLLYIVSPWDIIPEWIPVVGVLDDLALAALLLSWAGRFKVSGRESH
jgi:uncharacterized membrane protein YkvA (DUF1232 family)